MHVLIQYEQKPLAGQHFEPFQEKAENPLLDPLRGEVDGRIATASGDRHKFGYKLNDAVVVPRQAEQRLQFVDPDVRRVMPIETRGSLELRDDRSQRAFSGMG